MTPKQFEALAEWVFAEAAFAADANHGRSTIADKLYVDGLKSDAQALLVTEEEDAPDPATAPEMTKRAKKIAGVKDD